MQLPICAWCKKTRIAIINKDTIEYECGMYPYHWPIKKLIHGSRSGCSHKKHTKLIPPEKITSSKYVSVYDERGKEIPNHIGDCRFCEFAGNPVWLEEERMWGLECSHPFVNSEYFPRLYFPSQMTVEPKIPKRPDWGIKIVPMGSDYLPNSCFGYTWDGKRTALPRPARRYKVLMASSSSSKRERIDKKNRIVTWKVTAEEYGDMIYFQGNSLSEKFRISLYNNEIVPMQGDKIVVDQGGGEETVLESWEGKETIWKKAEDISSSTDSPESELTKGAPIRFLLSRASHNEEGDVVYTHSKVHTGHVGLWSAQSLGNLLFDPVFQPVYFEKGTNYSGTGLIPWRGIFFAGPNFNGDFDFSTSSKSIFSGKKELLTDDRRANLLPYSFPIKFMCGENSEAPVESLKKANIIPGFQERDDFSDENFCSKDGTKFLKNCVKKPHKVSDFGGFLDLFNQCGKDHFEVWDGEIKANILAEFWEKAIGYWIKKGKKGPEINLISRIQKYLQGNTGVYRALWVFFYALTKVFANKGYALPDRYFLKEVTSEKDLPNDDAKKAYREIHEIRNKKIEMIKKIAGQIIKYYQNDGEALARKSFNAKVKKLVSDNFKNEKFPHNEDPVKFFKKAGLINFNYKNPRGWLLTTPPPDNIKWEEHIKLYERDFASNKQVIDAGKEVGLIHRIDRYGNVHVNINFRLPKKFDEISKWVDGKIKTPNEDILTDRFVQNPRVTPFQYSEISISSIMESFFGVLEKFGKNKEEIDALKKWEKKQFFYRFKYMYSTELKRALKEAQALIYVAGNGEGGALNYEAADEDLQNLIDKISEEEVLKKLGFWVGNVAEFSPSPADRHVKFFRYSMMAFIYLYGSQLKYIRPYLKGECSMNDLIGGIDGEGGHLDKAIYIFRILMETSYLFTVFVNKPGDIRNKKVDATIKKQILPLLNCGVDVAEIVAGSKGVDDSDEESPAAGGADSGEGSDGDEEGQEDSSEGRPILKYHSLIKEQMEGVRFTKILNDLPGTLDKILREKAKEEDANKEEQLTCARNLAHQLFCTRHFYKTHGYFTRKFAVCPKWMVEGDQDQHKDIAEDRMSQIPYAAESEKEIDTGGRVALKGIIPREFISEGETNGKQIARVPDYKQKTDKFKVLDHSYHILHRLMNRSLVNFIYNRTILNGILKLKKQENLDSLMARYPHLFNSDNGIKEFLEILSQTEESAEKVFGGGTLKDMEEEFENILYNPMSNHLSDRKIIIEEFKDKITENNASSTEDARMIVDQAKFITSSKAVSFELCNQIKKKKKSDLKQKWSTYRVFREIKSLRNKVSRAMFNKQRDQSGVMKRIEVEPNDEKILLCFRTVDHIFKVLILEIKNKLNLTEKQRGIMNFARDNHILHLFFTVPAEQRDSSDPSIDQNGSSGEGVDEGGDAKLRAFSRLFPNYLFEKGEKDGGSKKVSILGELCRNIRKEVGSKSQVAQTIRSFKKVSDCWEGENSLPKIFKRLALGALDTGDTDGTNLFKTTDRKRLYNMGILFSKGEILDKSEFLDKEALCPPLRKDIEREDSQIKQFLSEEIYPNMIDDFKKLLPYPIIPTWTFFKGIERAFAGIFNKYLNKAREKVRDISEKPTDESAEERQATIFWGGGTRTAFRRILRDGAGFAWLKRTDLGLGQIIEDIREGLRLSTKFRPYRFQWSPSNNKNPFRDFFSIGIYYPEKEKDQFEMISKLSSISNTIKWAEEKKKEKGDYKLALRVNVPKLDFEGNEAIQDYAPFRQERISEKELVEEGDKFNHIQPSLKIHKYKPTEKKDRTSDINKIKIEKNKGFATETIEGKIKTKFYDKDNQDNMDAKTYLDKAIKNCKDKLDKISNQLKEEKFDAINSEYERYLSGVTGVQKRDFEEFEKSLKKIKKIKKEYEYFREKKGETLGKLRFLEREKNRYEFISEVDSWYLENKKDQNDDPKDSKQNKLKDLGERKNILAKGWENFLNYLNGEGGVSKSPTGPYYEIRMSNTMKRRLKAGAEVQAISILPPIPGKLSCTLSIHLKAKESIFKQRKNLIPSFNTISFEGEHAKKDVYHGLDINAMTSKTVLDNAFIDVSNVRPYLNASDSEEKKKEKASIPLPNETHQTSPIEIDFEIEDLKKDIAKMWGIKYESTDGDNGPFSNWWEKIETNFLGLNSESEPESENLNPYKTEDRRKKSLSELTFNEILMAPVAYTHRGRQHNMDHILNLKKAIGRERRKIKSNPDRPLTRLNRLQTEHYFRNRSYESKRDHMILYMAKVIAYLLSHGLSSSFAYEDLESLSTKGRTGFGAGIVNGMIKGYGKLEEVVKWIMTTWGTREKLEDVQMSAVNPGYTSRYHFTCAHLLRLYRKKLSNALGKRGSSIHFTNKMKQKLMAKGIPHKLSLSSVDRSAGADYGVCYFCSYLDKRRNSPREERGEEKKEDVKGRDKVSLPRSEAIFNAQNQAAANIAFRLFLKDATIT